MSSRPLAVVTGGSGGIGLELARELAGKGHDLIIVAENPADLEQAAQQLRREGVAVETEACDLSDERGVDQLCRTLSGRDIDVLCVNAGVGLGGRFIETDLDAELDMIDLNCRGAVQLVKPIVRAMVARGQGRILFTSSIAATMPGPFETVYAATKVFLRWLAQELREELKGSGVTVTTLMPSTTDTNFFRRAGMMDTRAGTQKKDDPAVVARAGVAALLAGRDQVTPTLKNKAMGTLAELLPDPIGAKLHRGLTEPGSARAGNRNGGTGSGAMSPMLIGAAALGVGALIYANREALGLGGTTSQWGGDGRWDA